MFRAMFREMFLAGSLLFAVALNCAAQSPDSAAQPPAAPAQKPAAQEPTKKKPKKVWTNDEIISVSGGVSVVGDSATTSKDSSSSKSEKQTSGDSPKDRQIAAYRDQIRQLQAQQDAADKKIADLRNFKAENTSSSGGINIKQGYSMTPVADQIKQLEDKKKQLQAKIDAIEDDARKNGIEPGQLR